MSLSCKASLWGLPVGLEGAKLNFAQGLIRLQLQMRTRLAFVSCYAGFGVAGEFAGDENVLLKIFQPDISDLGKGVGVLNAVLLSRTPQARR